MTAVLILTSPEYDDFVVSVISKHVWGEHQFFTAVSKVDYFEGYKYDVGISFMYTHKVPAKEVNSHSWFNFHPAPLPEYKGRDLCYHAIMNGEKEFGATLHYMDEGFDTGDIIECRVFDLDYWMTAQEVSEQAVWLSMRMFEEYLPKILETPVFPRLPNRGGTYYKKGEIVEEIKLKTDEPFAEWVRAVSFPSKGFHPRIDIGGVKYEIRRIE